MITPEQQQALKAPFPSEALSSDTSRGFELTSIKAAYVIERLNDVFGPCGQGWRYVHSPFEMLPTSHEGTEIVTEVALQYHVTEENGCPPILWHARKDQWHFQADAPHTWSEPLFACGGKSVGKGGAAFTDARKSAVTDGLTKAASMIGVGHQVFKGLVRLDKPRGKQGDPEEQGPSPREMEHRKPAIAASGLHPKTDSDKRPDADDATTFWTLYYTAGKAAGLSLEAVQPLTRQGNWSNACATLRTLITQTRQ